MEPTQDELSVALSTLCKYLREDEDYFRSWRDNISMAFQDEYDDVYRRINAEFLDGEELIPVIRDVANEAAKNFLNLLIHLDEPRTE